MLLGEKWLAAAPVIQVLAIAAALHSVAAAAGGSLFMGAGRPWLMFQMNGLRALAVVAMVFPLTMLFGLVGAAYAVLIASSLTFLFHIYHSFTILQLRVADYVKALWPALGAVIAISPVLFGFKQFAGPINLPGFVLVLTLVLLAYAGFFLLLWWKFKAGLLASIRQMAR
jgi:PST family polysaccharide transporter